MLIVMGEKMSEKNYAAEFNIKFRYSEEKACGTARPEDKASVLADGNDGRIFCLKSARLCGLGGGVRNDAF